MTILTDEYGLVLNAPPDPGSYLLELQLRSYEQFVTNDQTAFELLMTLELLSQQDDESEEEACYACQ